MKVSTANQYAVQLQQNVIQTQFK